MKFLIAGGGTGGHIYPGIALAQEVSTRNPQNEVLFVGSRRGLENTLVPSAGFNLEVVDIAGIKGKGLKGMVAGLIKIPLAVLASMRIIRRFKPDVALGVGGYASGPVIFAAWMLGVPTAIQEQNAYPGLANRILARFVRRVFVSFEAAATHFSRRKVLPLGNPIRRGFLDNFIRPEPEAREGFTLFFMGGSQGAHAVNLLAVDTAEILRDKIPDLRIVHQTGKKDEELVRARYAAIGVEAEVAPFFEKMTELYRCADLVVCRAGATTVAELAVCRKASILIPYPYAANNHQVMNAAALVEAGAAIMAPQMETSGESLANTILELYNDRPRIAEMARRSGHLGRPEAAREIVDACVQMARKIG